MYPWFKEFLHHKTLEHDQFWSFFLCFIHSLYVYLPWSWFWLLQAEMFIPADVSLPGQIPASPGTFLGDSHANCAWCLIQFSHEIVLCGKVCNSSSSSMVSHLAWWERSTPTLRWWLKPWCFILSGETFKFVPEMDFKWCQDNVTWKNQGSYLYIYLSGDSFIAEVSSHVQTRAVWVQVLINTWWFNEGQDQLNKQLEIRHDSCLKST